MNVDELYLEGNNFYFGNNGYNKDIQKAKECLNEAYKASDKQHPKYSLICVLLGEISFSEGYSDAENYFWEAIKYKSPSMSKQWEAVTWYRLGHIYRKKGEPRLFGKAKYDILGKAGGCFTEAAKLGYVPAMIDFSYLVITYRITPLKDEAETWIRTAWEKGNSNERKIAENHFKRLRNW